MKFFLQNWHHCYTWNAVTAAGLELPGFLKRCITLRTIVFQDKGRPLAYTSKVIQFNKAVAAAAVVPLIIRCYRCFPELFCWRSRHSLLITKALGFLIANLLFDTIQTTPLPLVKEDINKPSVKEKMLQLCTKSGVPPILLLLYQRQCTEDLVAKIL